MIDVNVSIGDWPFKDNLKKSPAAIQSKLDKLGISQAWVRSSNAAWLVDPVNDNAKLLKKVSPFNRQTAVQTINPRLSNWKSQISFEGYKVFNIYPSYHCYDLNSKTTEELAIKLSDNNKILLITIRMEDSRGMHPDCIIPDVPAETIVDFARKNSKLKIICLNSTFAEIKFLTVSASNIHCDIAYAEFGDTLKNILNMEVNYKQILFGSHYPFFYTEAAVYKVQYANVRSHIKDSILFQNI